MLKSRVKRSGEDLTGAVEEVGEELLERRRPQGKTVIVILKDWDHAYALAKTISEEVVDKYGITPVVRYGEIGKQRFIPYMFRDKGKWYVRVDFVKKIQNGWNGIRRYEIIDVVYADYGNNVWFRDFCKKIAGEICCFKL